MLSLSRRLLIQSPKWLLAPLARRTLADDAKNKKIGLIGMGSVGEAVFHNLNRKGFQIAAITDINPSQCQKYDVKAMSTAREVAEATDVVISALPKPPNVRAAFEGPDGILAGIKEGAVWIDHSTTDHGHNFEYQAKLDDKGAQLLECPITGGMDALRKGEMAVWVAGDRPTFDKNKAILDASYTTVMYMGGLGTAMIPKVISNMICTLNCIALGLDLPTFWHAIRASAGNSFLWETAGPCIMNGNFHSDFNMDLICKDIQLCFEMAKAAKVPIHTFGLMQQIYTQCLYQFGPEEGCYSAPRILEAALGEELRAPGFENWSYSIENVEGALQIKHKNIELELKAPEGQKTTV